MSLHLCYEVVIGFIYSNPNKKSSVLHGDVSPFDLYLSFYR